jgi:hypothetical protein
MKTQKQRQVVNNEKKTPSDGQRIPQRNIRWAIRGEVARKLSETGANAAEGPAQIGRTSSGAFSPAGARRSSGGLPSGKAPELDYAILRCRPNFWGPGMKRKQMWLPQASSKTLARGHWELETENSSAA